MLSWCHILYVWLNMEQAGKSIIMVCHMNESTYPNTHTYIYIYYIERKLITNNHQPIVVEIYAVYSVAM